MLLYYSFIFLCIYFFLTRRVQVQRVTEGLVLCGCVMASTSWCLDLTGTRNYHHIGFIVQSKAGRNER